MKKYFLLIKLHINYLLNKINTLLLGTLALIVLILLVISSKVFMDFSTKWLDRANYYSNYVSVTTNIFKIIIPIFSIFLYGSSFLYINNDYSLIIIKERKNKVVFYITKILSLTFVNTIIIFLITLMYFNFGKLSFGEMFNNHFNFSFWFDLIITSLIYGIISINIVIIVNNPFSYLIVMIFYIVYVSLCEMYNPNNLMMFIIPTIIENQKINNYFLNKLFSINLHLFGGIFIFYFKNQ